MASWPLNLGWVFLKKNTRCKSLVAPFLKSGFEIRLGLKATSIITLYQPLNLYRLGIFISKIRDNPHPEGLS